MRISRLLSPSISVALLAACAPHHAYPPPVTGPPAPGAVPCGGDCKDRVGITYLGLGGVLIRHGDDALLTAPVLSGPRLPRLLRLHPNEPRIDSLMRAWVPDAGEVRGVLVGHTHYDHTMDLPYLVRRWIPDPAVAVYGPNALAQTFAADPEMRGRVDAVEDLAGDAWHAGRWVSVGQAFRFMPIRSAHASHALGVVKVLPRRSRPLRYHPWWAFSYPEGHTLAYLIDVTDDDGRVLFRIHYQDAASTPPVGFPPPLEEADRRYTDLAIICGAAYGQVRGYPDSLVRWLKPRQVMVGHWEDFILRPRAPHPVDVPASDYGALDPRLVAALGGDASRRWVPVPGETRWYCVCPASTGG